MSDIDQPKTVGEQFDDISARMDAAYAERRKHKYGTPAYLAADEQVEAVYSDLRRLNAEIRGDRA